jgi:hypothetical protein
MSFIKIKRSELNKLIESFLFEEEGDSSILYVSDPNAAGYEYSYNKDTAEISITKSMKKKSTTKDNPTVVAKEKPAYKAIKALFADQLKAKPEEDKGKPVGDDRKLKKPFLKIGTVHELMEATLQEVITLTDYTILKVIENIPDGDKGIKDVLKNTTKDGKFKFGYVVDNISEKIVPGLVPQNKTLLKPGNFSYLTGNAQIQNKQIQKAYTLMTNGYRNLDGSRFARLSEVTDSILDTYINIAKRSLSTLKSGKKRQQRKSNDDITTLSSLIDALEKYKKEINTYIKRESAAFSMIFDEITKNGNKERAIEFLALQGLSIKVS